MNRLPTRSEADAIRAVSEGDPYSGVSNTTRAARTRALRSAHLAGWLGFTLSSRGIVYHAVPGGADALRMLAAAEAEKEARKAARAAKVSP